MRAAHNAAYCLAVALLIIGCGSKEPSKVSKLSDAANDSLGAVAVSADTCARNPTRENWSAHLARLEEHVLAFDALRAQLGKVDGR